MRLILNIFLNIKEEFFIFIVVQSLSLQSTYYVICIISIPWHWIENIIFTSSLEKISSMSLYSADATPGSNPNRWSINWFSQPLISFTSKSNSWRRNTHQINLGMTSFCSKKKQKGHVISVQYNFSTNKYALNFQNHNYD